MGNKLVVVDVANVRPAPVAQRGLFGRRGERARDVFTSIEFIDSLLLDISAQIPCASVVAIADRVLQHRFEKPSDQSVFRERTRLPATDPEFIYLMPPQAVRRDSRKIWGRRAEGEAGEFVEADELILSVAAASEGLVVSGDYYRDSKYRNLVEWLAGSHYVPVRDTSHGSWLLCAKTKAMRLRGREREEPLTMRSIAGINPIHLTSAGFDRESDLFLRRHIFETVIPQFWADRSAGEQIFTIGDRSPLVFRPFSALRLPERIPEIRELEIQEPVETVTEELLLESDALEPVLLTGPTDQIAEPIEVRRRLRKQLWASNSSSNLRYINQIVSMIGQVFLKSDGNQVLRWVYPYGSIRIIGEVPKHVRRAVDVVKLQGLLRKEDEELVLDINTYATRQVEPFDLQDLYRTSIIKIRALHMQPKIRSWSPPVPKRLVTQPESVVRTAPASRIMPFIKDELVEIEQPEQREISEAASMKGLQNASSTSRNRTGIAVLLLLSAIVIAVAIALWQFIGGANPTSEGKVIRDPQAVTVSQVIRESGALSMSGFYRYGNSGPKW